MNRRYFFFGLLGLAAACKKQPRVSHRAHPVSIARANSYSAERVDPIRRILTEHRVPVAGKRVLLKPNLVEFSPAAPINTHPVFVAAVAEAFRSVGAASVRIAEGPGHRRMTLDMAESAGYFQAVPNFERIFTDLNLDDVRAVSIPRPLSKLTQLYLPQAIFDCDLLVSLPKMKTHHWAGATLSMKNLFGIVPGAVYGWPKNLLHWAGIDESVADLHMLFPEHFSIVDGIQGMEGNGPILGAPRDAGVIVAGPHAPSVDATCCQVMGINPDRIRYLELIADRTGWRREQVREIAESSSSVRTDFALTPDFAHLRL